jgi:imidazolonepropionase-like amidohydrolase
VPQGAEEADGRDGVIHAVRSQIRDRADWIEVYADASWGPTGLTAPTYALEELEAAVETARSSGRSVAAHARSSEGVWRAVLAAVATMEHGDSLTPEDVALMVRRGVALCPTLAGAEVGFLRQGWRKGTEPLPAPLAAKQRSFRAALAAGVLVCNGSDVGPTRTATTRASSSCSWSTACLPCRRSRRRP